MSQEEKIKSFEFIPSDGYITIKLSGALESSDAERMLNELGGQADEVHVVINCEHLSEMGLPGMRALLQISKKCKTRNKLIRVLAPNAHIRKLLKDNGVNAALPTASSLREALVDFGLVTAKTLDVNFINPFLNATIKALEIQAGITATPGEIYRKKSDEKLYGDISGVIGMVSDAFVGSVVISFPAETFLKVMSKMLGEEFTVINKDIEDGAAEFTNIIFGQAKAELNEKGYGIKTALPSVVSGKDHNIQNVSHGPRVVIPFTTDQGKFVVEVCLSE